MGNNNNKCESGGNRCKSNYDCHYGQVCSTTLGVCVPRDRDPNPWEYDGYDQDLAHKSRPKETFDQARSRLYKENAQHRANFYGRNR